MTRTLRINGFAGEIKWPPLVAEQVSWIEKRRINNYRGSVCVWMSRIVNSCKISQRGFQFFGKIPKAIVILDIEAILGICIQLQSRQFLICKIIPGLNVCVVYYLSNYCYSVNCLIAEK